MNARAFLGFLVVSSGLAAVSSVGCSSGDIAVGSTDQALQKKKDGTPTGNGQTCAWDNGGTYKVGDTFKSLDGCNDCSCSAQGILCTMRACAPAPGGGTCSYGGKTYSVGQTFKSTDGCNSCGCQAGGEVACTEMACAPAPACKKTGCSGQICSDQDIASTCEWTEAYACYQTAICERGGDGKCGFRNTPELQSCLDSKKTP